MPTFRERIANIFYGDKIRRADRLIEASLDTIRRFPYLSTPEQLIDQLKEFDSRYLDLLIRMIRDQEGWIDYSSDSVRSKIVTECRSLYVWDPITQNIVDLWTDYGFGTVVIVPSDSAYSRL